MDKKSIQLRYKLILLKPKQADINDLSNVIGFKPENGISKPVFGLLSDQKYLVAYRSQKTQTGEILIPVGLIAFQINGKKLSTINTIVHKDFRAQGIATRMNLHLWGIARNNGYA